MAVCLKHYVGYSTPTREEIEHHFDTATNNGRISSAIFKESVEAALTVMVNSGEVNGIPGHANHYLLTEVLKEKWGFCLAVSDWEDFIKLHKEHKTAATLKDGIASAIAGVDMSMVPNSPDYKTYFELFVELVNEGRVTSRLDDVVRRILRVKHHLDLFEKALFRKRQITQNLPPKSID